MTRRGMRSVISLIYDPLGFHAHFARKKTFSKSGSSHEWFG